ncbi:MAG: hypothetical protein HYV26_03875 [Candidatus Hydrogenedentes bacterium]|nr:hypothetical protein [Candidatus Hydrogenedentota bacterium]MBI3117240.1 hypothetical protein [Candidatus Hydrogenedentota bacterium]
MTTPAVDTMVGMVESLPEDVQQQVVEYLREYLEDLRDEMRWDQSFARTRPKLIDAARHARREIAAGNATPLDLDQL